MYSDETAYYDYNGKIPIIATTLDRLRAHGLTGPAWQRFGHPDGWETFTRPSPTRKAAWNERQEAEREARREQEQHGKAQRKEAEMEARRCPTCHRRPDDPAYRDQRDAGDGTHECTPCRGATQVRNDAEADRARAERSARLSPRPVRHLHHRPDREQPPRPRPRSRRMLALLQETRVRRPGAAAPCGAAEEAPPVRLPRRASILALLASLLPVS